MILYVREVYKLQMIPPGSIIYMKEGPYSPAAGRIVFFNIQTSRFRLCLLRADIYIWARASEFEVVAIMDAEDEEFDVEALMEDGVI